MDSPTPTEIKLHRKSRSMEIAFSDGRSFRLPYEYLRRSAEVGASRDYEQALTSGKSGVIWKK